MTGKLYPAGLDVEWAWLTDTHFPLPEGTISR